MIALSEESHEGVQRFVVSGPVTAADLETLINQGCPVRPCARRCIIDLVNADLNGFHYPQIAAVAHKAELAQLPCRSMRAALVVRSSLTLGICRMFQLLRDDVAEHWSIHPDLESAEQWLRTA